MAADFPIRIQEGLEQQISLFRSFLEISAGKVDCRQHDFEEAREGLLKCVEAMRDRNADAEWMVI